MNSSLQKEKLYRKTSHCGGHETLSGAGNTGFDKARD